MHLASRRTGRFIKVNIAGFDDTLFSDVLFGHRKGAYSGADQEREGLLKAAHNGTLFLDEISELDSRSQVKLLRLLECGEYYPLGSDKVERSTARIIAATNADLHRKVQEGSIRKDFHNRLAVLEAEIPPLRRRLEDLPELITLFTTEAARKFNKEKCGYQPELIQLLKQYHFPGNIRELKNMITTAMSRQKENNPLGLAYFRQYLKKRLKREIKPEAETVAGLFSFSGAFPMLDEREGILIHEAISRKHRITEAAVLLGIDRFKFSRLLKKHGGRK